MLSYRVNPAAALSLGKASLLVGYYIVKKGRNELKISPKVIHVLATTVVAFSFNSHFKSKN